MLVLFEGSPYHLGVPRGTKEFKCILEQFPYPTTESSSSLTKCNDMDEDDDDEKEVKARQPTPPRPEQLPFPPSTEENMPRLKAWLIERFSTSSFNTSSAPLAKMSGPPIKIHINPEASSEAIQKTIPIPHHWPETVMKELLQDQKPQLPGLCKKVLRVKHDLLFSTGT